MVKKKLTDFDLLDFGASRYADVLSPQQARVWVGVFVVSWSNGRIARALNIDTKTVRSTLYETRKLVAVNPKIAYRSIDSIK